VWTRLIEEGQGVERTMGNGPLLWKCTERDISNDGLWIILKKKEEEKKSGRKIVPVGGGAHL